MAGALAGTRVLDLIDGEGAYGPKLLAGMGADVVRVEPPGGGPQRRRPPFYLEMPHDEDPLSLYFLHYNSGKRGITLDYRIPAGRELLRRLLDSVDVVFDNGQLSSLGLDPEALAAKKPPLVIVSVTPFGLKGDRAGWAGGDLVIQAMSGMIQIFGYRNERPARFGPEQGSEMSGLAAALGALIALLGAHRHGAGELVDIAMERVCALVTAQMSNASMYHQFGFRRERVPRAEAAPGGLYQAKDGYVSLGAYRNPDLLLELFEALGAAEAMEQLRARFTPAQFVNNPEVDAVVAQTVATVSRDELAEVAQAHGILCLPVNDAAELVNDPFLKQRAFFVEIEHPELEATFVDAGTPLRFSATPYRITRRPPLLGEHNAEVYGGVGVDDAHLATLRRDGVV